MDRIPTPERTILIQSHSPTHTHTHIHTHSLGYVKGGHGKEMPERNAGPRVTSLARWQRDVCRSVPQCV